MQIVRVDGALPPGIAELSATAAAEGVRNVARLLEAWEDGTQRFDHESAAFFAANVEGELAGIGGVRREEAAGESAMRMHRFYVHPAYRRLGIGKRIAHAAMAHALAHAALLTCNARASAAAGPFWESLGFSRCEGYGYTHIFRTRMNSPAWQPCAISHKNPN